MECSQLNMETGCWRSRYKAATAVWACDANLTEKRLKKSHLEKCKGYLDGGKVKYKALKTNLYKGISIGVKLHKQ